MSSADSGLATAKLELLGGYPAYLYSPGDGSYISAMDTLFGLPIRQGGDSNPDIEWMCGFNRGVKEYVRQCGLPWNSRLPSLDILSDLAAYFHRRAPEAVRLQAKGADFRPEGFGFALTLDHGSMGVSVKLQGDNLFKDPHTVPGAMMAYRSGPPPASRPTTPSPPAVAPGTELVWLRWFDGARRVDCLPARLGSQRHNIAPLRHIREGPDGSPSRPRDAKPSSKRVMLGTGSPSSVQ